MARRLAITPDEIPIAHFRGPTHRLIASRSPTIGVFDALSSPEDLEDALLLEQLTHDRVAETLTHLSRMDRGDWVVDQAGATMVMAAFCHPAPGGHFSTDALGLGIARPRSRRRSPRPCTTTRGVSLIPHQAFATPFRCGS